MRNRLLDFPHPVLSELGKDYVESSFSITLVSVDDSGNDLKVKLRYNLACDGLRNLVGMKKASVIVRTVCLKTLFRKFSILNDDETEIIINKKDVSGTVEIEPWIVVNQDIDNFRLEEFNKDYFGMYSFNLKKGMVLAVAQGFEIKLNNIIEQNLRSIVCVTSDRERNYYHVSYPKISDSDTVDNDYITIYLPVEDYNRWRRLGSNKYKKNGVDKFLQCSIVLPVIVEALSLLKADELTEDDEKEYLGTIWADSIYNALRKRGIHSLEDCEKSCSELANMLLNEISTVSLMELEEKMNELSMVPMNWED